MGQKLHVQLIVYGISYLYEPDKAPVIGVCRNLEDVRELRSFYGDDNLIVKSWSKKMPNGSLVEVRSEIVMEDKFKDPDEEDPKPDENPKEEKDQDDHST